MPAQRGSDAAVAERNQTCIREGVHEARREGQTYSLAKDGKSIHCWLCGRTSYSMGDVQHLYCGCCQQFHAMLSLRANLN
jgi:hypothetical protein